jgi:hypothetical protein
MSFPPLKFFLKSQNPVDLLFLIYYYDSIIKEVVVPSPRLRYLTK